MAKEVDGVIFSISIKGTFGTLAICKMGEQLFPGVIGGQRNEEGRLAVLTTESLQVIQLVLPKASKSWRCPG